jgi:putative tricarboxylic transport membrane protein
MYRSRQDERCQNAPLASCVPIAADANRSRRFGIATRWRMVQHFHVTESRLKVWLVSMSAQHQINHHKKNKPETTHVIANKLFARPVLRAADFAAIGRCLPGGMKHITFGRTRLAAVLLPLLLLLSLWSNVVQALECIVPAKPGGGMDGVCKMMRKVLSEQDSSAVAMKISYLPGGIGAVAWSSVVSQRRGGPDTLVTFSGGSLLNLAQGKYGNAAVGDVRWLAGVAADYGMIAVRSDAPYKNLRELVDAMRRTPARITIGVSGTIGSQDWLKVALIARRAGMDPKNFRFVALEGGGDSFTALQADHVQVVSGDASEAAAYFKEGRFRVLAVLSEQRLPGLLANVATAREQGFDVVWPIIRGFYMSAHASDADYQRWVGIFDRAMASQAFADQRAASGLYPFSMTGAALTAHIRQVVEQYRKQSQELGLVR